MERSVSAAPSPFSAFRPLMTMPGAPSRASLLAMASPRPCVPPVMIAMMDRFRKKMSTFTSGGTLIGKGGYRVQADPVLQQRKVNVLFTSAVLELVDNDCTNNNATFNNLLPEGRHIHQVKGIVQHTDNQRTHNRACNCPDSTGRKRGATDDCGRDRIQFVADSKPRLP